VWQSARGAATKETGFVIRRTLWGGLAALLMLVAGAAHADLDAYVKAPDDSYTYTVVEQRELDQARAYVVKMTSQTWRGIPWWHWMTVVVPTTLSHPDTALLLVDGGNNRDPEKVPGMGTEVQVLARVATQTGSVTARVGQVPNQPLMGDRYEDALIAYTYDKYLTTGEEDWPLLFPMVKSAAAAMTTVQRLVEAKREAKIAGFVLTGGSKRGWTSWLAAAADARVKAIAPFVIDTLNMVPQSEHQMKTYGGYSEQVADYTEYRMQERTPTPEGQRLLKMVDPYAYRDRLTLPKMIVLGANDPYWTVDAANFYFDDLPGEKHLYYQANTGHDTSLQGVSTLSHFYDSVVKGQPFPKVSWSQASPNELEVTWSAAGGKALLWTATSPNRDFRPSTWSSQPLEGEGKVVATVPTPETGWVAYYVEVQFPGHLGMPFGSTSKMTVLPETFPTSGRAYDAPPAAASEREE
jgi:PhoPQ-activated pathogenicity-related protein